MFNFIRPQVCIPGENSLVNYGYTKGDISTMLVSLPQWQVPASLPPFHHLKLHLLPYLWRGINGAFLWNLVKKFSVKKADLQIDLHTIQNVLGYCNTALENTSLQKQSAYEQIINNNNKYVYIAYTCIYWCVRSFSLAELQSKGNLCFCFIWSLLCWRTIS